MVSFRTRDTLILIAVILGSIYWVIRQPEPKRINPPLPVISGYPHTPKPLPSFPVIPTQANIPPYVKLKIPIVMYHYVETVRDPRDVLRVALSIKPKIFNDQMAALKKYGYTSYFVRDIPDMLRGGRVPTIKPIILTFDDGYEDFFTDAYPILKKYGIKSTQYVICNLMGTPGYLTKEQVVEMSKSGLVEIGAHTMNHLNLKTVPDRIALQEITKCKTILSAITGKPVETFAYPYGGFNARTPKMVEDAGYTSAVSVNPGNVQSKENLYTLTRIRAGHLMNIPQIDTVLQNWK